jgi:Flp pilus assembly protein TadD
MRRFRRRRRWLFTRSTLLGIALGGVSLACRPNQPPSQTAAPPNAPHTSTLSGDVARNTERAHQETAKAFDLIQSGKYADAEPVLKRALDADAMYGPARNDLGVVYFHQNRLYDAAWEFTNATKLMPRQAEPQNNLGLVMERAGRLDEAMQAFGKAVELEPENPSYVGNLASTRIRLGLQDEHTRRLLELLVLKAPNTEWADWARANLTRLRAAPTTMDTTTPSMIPEH